MKKTTLRILAALLAVIMTLGAAPLETLTGIDFESLFEVKASAGGEEPEQSPLIIESFDQNISWDAYNVIRKGGITFRYHYWDPGYLFSIGGKRPVWVSVDAIRNASIRNDFSNLNQQFSTSESPTSYNSKVYKAKLDKGIYLSFFRVYYDYSKENGIVVLQCKRYGNVALKFKDSVFYNDYGAYQRTHNPSDALNYRRATYPNYNETDYLHAIERNESSKVAFTPTFDVYIDNTKENIKNKRLAYAAKYEWQARGFTNLSKKEEVQRVYSKIDYFVSSVDTLVDLYDLCNEPTIKGLWKSSKGVYNLVKNAHLTELDEQDRIFWNNKVYKKGSENSEPQFLSNTENGKYCVFFRAESPYLLVDDNNYFQCTTTLHNPSVKATIKFNFFLKEDDETKGSVNPDNSISFINLQDNNIKGSSSDNFLRVKSAGSSSVEMPNGANGVSVSIKGLSGTIKNKNSRKITSYGFVYGKNSSPTIKNNKIIISSNATTKGTIDGSCKSGELTPNTKYYYRMYAVCGGHYYYSEVKSFISPKVRPKNTTLKSVNAIHYKTNKELNSNELGVGDRIKISWNPATYAEKYLLRERVRASADAPWGAWKLIGGERTGTAATVVLTEVGEHEFQICAKNSAGNSDWTPAKTAIVHPDVTVKFMTGNETDGYKLYQENTVTWRHALEDQLPEIPVDFGYVFVGWFRMGASALTGFQELTEDLTVYAKYKPSKYTVVFKDQTGNILKVNGKDSQIVEYGNPAIEPTDIPVKDGYQFIGWNKDIHHIVEDTEIVAVTDSLDYTRPVEVTDVSATRYSYGYVVYCTVTNTTLKDTYGRIVIAMKTDEGKLVQTTESAAYHLNGKTTNSDTGETVIDSERIKILVPTYQTEEGLSVNATADRAEVYAVENFKSMVPVSSVVSAAVIDADPYTDWCIVNDVNPGSSWAKYQQYYTDDSIEKEEKTQYRYSDYLNSKTEDEAELARLHGENWEDNESDPPVNTGRYRYGSWSKTKPSGEYDTKTVTDSYKTVYWYKRWKYYNKGKGAWYYSYSSTWAQSMGYGGSWEYKDTTSELAYLKTVDGVKEYAGVWFRADCNGQSAHTTFKQTVNDKTHTEYRSKTPIYQYSVYKWSNFTNYSDTYVAEIENRRHVETRQMVRFKLEVPRVTDNSGVVREDFCVGSIGAEYAGKEAVLVIYKINEAADWTIEHIAQTVIDEDGNYFFDSYKLREEPSVMTGDYTAMLGIGGASDAIYLGTIEAPKPDLTVRYYDKVTGALISEPQTVPYGGNAEAPVPPEQDGMEFSHWDMRSTNITQDTDIYAEYTEKLYTVTFVDWQRDQLANVDAHHGDPVLSYIPPEFSAGNLSESGELQFVGWDVADEATVTENIVVTAVYEPRVLTVSYLDTVGEDSDEDGKNDVYTLNVSSTMEEAGEMAATDPVAYGEFISPPTPEVDENVLFFGWALAENPDEIVDVTATPITEDVVYTPVYCFADTAETPEISLATGSYDSAQTATITCATENALIYYTTDGSDPATSDTAMLYTAPISIAETTQLRAVAMCFNMNNSAEVSALYVINDGTGANQRLLTVCFGPSDHNATYLIVEEGGTIADLIPEQEGYTFEAAYRAYDWAEVEDGEDAELVYSDPWDLQNDVVSEDVTLYLDYTPNNYTVSFVDQDGFILSEDEVPYMSEAVPPEDPSMDGYVFTGWDTEDYLTVTGDLEVHAVYVPEDEYVIVKLNHSRYYTMTGSSFALEATTEGNDEGVTLTWSSSDASVATVDDTGRVTATGRGEAEITVTVDQNGESATCVLTVMGNPAQELTLKDSSKLTVMQYQTPTDPENEEGTGESVPLLLGFTVETEGDDHHAPTVAQIKAEFKSDGLVFTAADGTPLADTDYIGTGTMIQLTENGEVLDELTAIVVGDLDGDGHVTNRDAAQILRFYKPYEDTVPVSAESLDYIQLIAMDVNADGGVNTRDVSMLLRYLVGKEKIA